MKLAVMSKRETNVVVLNYTKNHQKFWNTLRLRPIFSPQSQLVGYVGEIFSFPITDRWMNNRPKLCLDDALALMRVMAMVPRFVTPAEGEEAEPAAQVGLCFMLFGKYFC
jgi:hypothetical protein